mgnify:CR=1 FL=1
MKKNVVFIPNIDCGDGRNKPFHYSVKSWDKWAEQHDDVEVIEWAEPLMDIKEFPVIYQREWVFDILDYNKVDYDQIAIVDADTIIHPNCPNFFKKTDNKYTVVVNNGCFEWVMRSINAWSKHLFPEEIKPRVWEYHNAGLVVANKEHRWFFDIIKNFYLENINKINDIRINKTYQNLPLPSTGQTIVNFLLIKHKVERTFLPERYNMTDLFRKNLLHLPGTGHEWWPDELTFLDAAWIYQFSAIPQNPRHVEYWMERTYKELYG